MTGSKYPPIADYALIGDCHTAALISRDGSIDWYCPGRFDAPAAFCRLLDRAQGGYFRVTPTGEFSSDRRYVDATTLLETTFSTSTGRVRLTDFMPGRNRLIRRVEGIGGEVEVGVEFKPTFDYARGKTLTDGGIAHCGNQYLTLAGPSHRFTVRAGECQWLVLSYTESAEDAQQAAHVTATECEKQLDATRAHWEDWAAKCTYKGPYREQVLRSASVLKLLTYEPTGAVVAAPTTSLPERIGGERNWDYRFTWLRDSALILYALVTIGYDDGASDFMHWLERTVAKDPTHRPQIMYGIDGRRDLREETLDHLEGYCDSRPVRIGNAAADQIQLDIYGEVLRSAALHYHQGRGHITEEAWRVLRGLVEDAAKEWQQSGSGIWEVRGGPAQFLYGKLMCWAALDSGIRLACDHKLDAPLEDWRHTREQIRQAILERGYNPDMGAFTQALDSSALDASALVMPRVGFLPPTDPRVRRTVQQIQRQLTKNGLVFRYRTPDGFAGGEGTFTLCTFWLVDALALGGELDQARALFERTIRYTNDLGLLAEEIDPDTGHQLGNFPQGFSHLALIGAAVNLAKAARHGSEHHAENEGDRAERAGRAASS